MNAWDLVGLLVLIGFCIEWQEVGDWALQMIGKPLSPDGILRKYGFWVECGCGQHMSKPDIQSFDTKDWVIKMKCPKCSDSSYWTNQHAGIYMPSDERGNIASVLEETK